MQEAVKKEGMFWVVGSNKWTASKYSKEDALCMAESMIDCSECIDCSYCMTCNKCTRCAHCVCCSDLLDCHYCIECDHSSMLVECHRCCYTDECIHQSDLRHHREIYRQPSFLQRFEDAKENIWEVRYYKATPDDVAKLSIVSRDGDVFEDFKELYETEVMPDEVKQKIKVIEDYLKNINK